MDAVLRGSTLRSFQLQSAREMKRQYPITRIDPATNEVAQQFFGPGGDAIRVGHGSVWLSNLRAHNVWRLDPKKILAARP